MSELTEAPVCTPASHREGDHTGRHGRPLPRAAALCKIFSFGGGCLLSLLFSFSAMNVRYLVNKRVLSFFSFNVNRIANVETTANTTWPGFPFSSRRGVLCQGSDALGAVLVGTHPHPHIAPRHGFSIARSRLHDRCPRNASQEQRHPLPGWRSRGPGGPPLWQAGTLPGYSLPRL